MKRWNNQSVLFSTLISNLNMPQPTLNGCMLKIENAKILVVCFAETRRTARWGTSKGTDSVVVAARAKTSSGSTTPAWRIGTHRLRTFAIKTFLNASASLGAGSASIRDAPYAAGIGIFLEMADKASGLVYDIGSVINPGCMQ